MGLRARAGEVWRFSAQTVNEQKAYKYEEGQIQSNMANKFDKSRIQKTGEVKENSHIPLKTGKQGEKVPALFLVWHTDKDKLAKRREE